jgi:hypothetical protein
MDKAEISLANGSTRRWPGEDRMLGRYNQEQPRCCTALDSSTVPHYWFYCATEADARSKERIRACGEEGMDSGYGVRMRSAKRSETREGWERKRSGNEVTWALNERVLVMDDESFEHTNDDRWARGSPTRPLRLFNDMSSPSPTAESHHAQKEALLC